MEPRTKNLKDYVLNKYISKSNKNVYDYYKFYTKEVSEIITESEDERIAREKQEFREKRLSQILD